VDTHRRKIKPTEKNEYQVAAEGEEEILRLQKNTKCVKNFVITTTQPTENVKDGSQEQSRFEFNKSQI